MSANEPPGPRSRGLPLIRLCREDNAVIVVPDELSQSERFHLPRIDKSLVDWLSSGLEQILREYQSCVAVLLVLDLSSRQWSYVIHRQCAGADAACWQLNKDPTITLSPASRIAGSLQVRVLGAGEEAADAVPPVDGLHIVQVFKDDILTTWCFLHVQQEAVHVNPLDVIELDLMRLVTQIRQRTEFV